MTALSLSPAAAGPLVTAMVFRPLIVLGPLADSDTVTPLGILRVASAPGRWLAASDTPLGTRQVVTADNGLPILLVVTIVVSSVQEPESDVSAIIMIMVSSLSGSTAVPVRRPSESLAPPSFRVLDIKLRTAWHARLQVVSIIAHGSESHLSIVTTKRIVRYEYHTLLVILLGR